MRQWQDSSGSAAAAAANTAAAAVAAAGTAESAAAAAELPFQQLACPASVAKLQISLVISTTKSKKKCFMAENVLIETKRREHAGQRGPRRRATGQRDDTARNAPDFAELPPLAL
jgi:hypothetical protein